MDRRGLQCERQKRCLKRILSRVLVAKNAAAHTEHHRSMPADDRLERPPSDGILCGREVTEQLSIGHSADRASSVEGFEVASE